MNKNNEKDYNTLIKKSIFFGKKNDFISAKAVLKKAININPIKTTTYINLSNIYILENDLKSSKKILYDYIKKYSFDIEIINHLGKIFINFDLIDECIEFKKFFLENKKSENNFFYIYFLFGIAYEKKEEFLDAINVYKISINYNKSYIENYLNLCNIFEKTNKINELDKIIKQAKNNCKPDARIDYFLSLLYFRKKEYSHSNSIINNKKLEKELLKYNNYFSNLLDLKFKNFEKLKSFKKGFEVIKKKNLFVSNIKENKKYDKKQVFKTIKAYKKFYKTKQPIPTSLDKHPNIVFIVGFPRSGTTLLDTILRTHSKTLVLEEKPYLLNLRHEFFKKKNNKLESINEITKNEIAIIQKKYLENINYKNNKIIIDKFPLTIIEIGFIKKIFPKSKIILSMRHPCDTVLSCFFSNFKINEAMINFLDLKDSVNFYNNTFELFEIYNKSLKLEFLTVKYEDLVVSFEQTLNKVLNFLSLKYEKKLNKFYETARNRKKINTPSYNQVTEPLYKTSINRWKNFEDVIFLKKDLKKWIKKFDY